jgi:hypothetical protein
MKRAPTTANGYHRAIEHPASIGDPDHQAGQGLGDVVRDAIDHVSIIVGDSMTLGKLEAKRLTERVGQTTKEVAPRIAFGASAAVFGFVGVIFGLIAIFIALGEVIPSVVARLGIYAVVFLAVASVSRYLAARPMKRAAELDPSVKPVAGKPNSLEEKSRKLTPVNPVGSLGE